MAWKETSPVNQRYEFILEYEKRELSMAALCREFGISQKTGYKWLKRWKEAPDPDSLRDRSRAPLTCPHRMEKEIRELLLACRSRYPRRGARKLLSQLKVSHPAVETWPAASTVTWMLKHEGLVVPRRRRPRASPSGVFSPCPHANDTWSIDFKGWWTLGNGAICYPLTILDSSSRYLLRLQGVDAQSEERTRPIVEAAFREYGLPGTIRSDNGPPFGSVGLGGLTKLAIWWMRLGILPERIDPGRPQQNGRHERMHKTLKEEVATTGADGADMHSQQRELERFLRDYNEVRPHEAHGQAPPSTVYTASARPYPERLPKPEYESGMTVRRVDDGGQVRMDGERFYVGRAFSGEDLGLVRGEDGEWTVRFCAKELGRLDRKSMRVKPVEMPS